MLVLLSSGLMRSSAVMSQPEKKKKCPDFSSENGIIMAIKFRFSPSAGEIVIFFQADDTIPSFILIISFTAGEKGLSSENILIFKSLLPGGI
ncbi:MAG: hypothetical protein BWX96_03298 [Bacteroidetes bacterium ADurb.Bin145]|nr:MAG: hypothetical protein BWX96_03298 [Bacteroidetes bacterium ADurb.Bin145]